MMKRKSFLRSLGATALLLPAGQLFASGKSEKESFRKFKIPSYLKPGDKIGISSPAGYISSERVQPSVERMQDWGYEIVMGDTIGKRDFTFGGTDAERLQDFQRFLDDPEIKAIMCARGGYGFVRIIDDLDFSKFIKHPKWIIGFSDITVIHSHLSRHYGIASIHSKMCNSFPIDWAAADELQQETILSIDRALKGEVMKYTAKPSVYNRSGMARAALVGGNLSILANMSASDSEIDTKNRILYLEDTGESLYAIDRMFWNLKRSGKLDDLKALIIGGFSLKSEDPTDPFGKSLYDIVLEKVKHTTYPVVFDFPVGHQKDNYALKNGVIHDLQVSIDAVSLTST